MIKTLAATAVLATLLYVGARPVGPVPAMGPFLDPMHGVWPIVADAELPDSAAGSVSGLSGPVRVLYDDRAVPHIFAGTVEDATRALGYVVARDRLFQLELQTRATAGRLSELVGPAALPVDRNQRALGLAWAAERNFADLDPNGDVSRLLEAYAEGVNAWIDGLTPRDVPFEYHLLGARPQRWLPQYSLYLLKRMGWTLSFNSTERRKRDIAALVGWEAADALLPLNNPYQEPIQPNGVDGVRFEPLRLPPPAEPAPDQTGLRLSRMLYAMSPRAQPFFTSQPATGPDCDEAFAAPECALSDDVVFGSNNWSAGPTKTASGRALLAGDPHLDLTLPSIWYEAHVVVPGELDVYGVTIPGMPGIVIGFNRNVAWSFTNTGSDVLDFYHEEVDDPARPRQYRLDGAWRPLELRVEEYRDRRGHIIATDTLYHTHRGPLMAADSAYYSMRWTVLEEQGEFEAFDRALRAKTVDQWLEALESYEAPTQNGIVADRNGSIAIRSSGRYPIRPGNGRGDVVREGSASANDWIGDLPVARYPFSVDPSQGFLASANQQPIDPRASRDYMGSDWPSPWRAIRINELLRGTDRLTPDDFRRFQTDPGSARADLLVPAFVAAGRADTSGPDSMARHAADLLDEWDRRYTKDDTRAVLFELAMDELARLTWDELEAPGDGQGGGRRVATPGSSVLAALLTDSQSVWWDNRSTPVRESRDDILRESLHAALVTARARYGPENEGGWQWDRIRHANIYHLLRLPGLSALDLPVQGGPSTLSPSSGSGTHGASWRMVVELGDEVTAQTIYPGGQSGNPLSSRYRDRVPTWVDGQLEPVHFPRSPEDLTDTVVSVLTLVP